MCVNQTKVRIRQRLLESRIVSEILEQFRVIRHEFETRSTENLVMRDADVLLVTVRFGVAVRFVDIHLTQQFIDDADFAFPRGMNPWFVKLPDNDAYGPCNATNER